MKGGTMADYCDPDLMLIIKTAKLLCVRVSKGSERKRWMGHNSNKILLYYY